MNDVVLRLPWLEIGIAASVVGAFWVALRRDPVSAYRWSLVFTGITFAATFLEWLNHYLWQLGYAGVAPPGPRWMPWGWPSPFAVDALSAPLLPLVALLHLLTALATARTKMSRYAFDGMLISNAVRLAAFGCKSPWVLIAMLVAGVLPTFFELRARKKATVVFGLHMGLFAVLLVAGWWCVDHGATALGSLMLLGAILVRCGTVPVHCWVTDLFENGSLGNAMLFLTPLPGVYAAVRLVLPVAPAWVLTGIGVVSLITAVYAACMALVQRDPRRFFAFLVISHASLVLVGMELVGLEDGDPAVPLSLVGSLALWFSVSLSLGGLGLTLRALEARWGRLSMASYQGLYEHSPSLAVCFLLTGLAAVGFPGTLGFISSELLVDGALEANKLVGLGVILASAINGVALVRAYFLLFTGARRTSSLRLFITPRERVAVLTLTALIIGGGLFPQPGVRSRYDAAKGIVAERTAQAPKPEGEEQQAAALGRE